MVDIPTVVLDRLAFIEANYQYELIALSGRPPQCLLLLGHESPDKNCLLSRCVNIPLSLKPVAASCTSFEYDINQVNRRIELTECTNPGLKPLGIMVLNETLYDYSPTLQRLMTQVDGLRYLFTYDPLQESSLSCHSVELDSHRLTLNRVHHELRDSSSNMDLGFREAAQDEAASEQEFTIKLAGKINRIIQYLRHSNDIDPKVLRSVSLLVSQLRRHPTDDIEEEIMNKESEISAFRTACEQWEIGTCFLRNKPVD
ncbi:hypothetical protein HG536_0G01130 [Torulaspora globosa]|uniref:Rpn11/EIF3F C-terminal domain-containing protein n=1 Tax=Torulaspora globosa TaxID=48254 RepID=A0A7G3ZL68_9SACH|nr:uncharacterized protein HG536_0G01130 [Torulaspora globosa]QLL34254.1 hypothetical protein HG536_0G01130 [Torulaspora globosa]